MEKIDVKKISDSELLTKYKICEILYWNYDNYARANEGYDKEMYSFSKNKCDYYHKLKQMIMDEMEIRLGGNEIA